MGTAGRHWKWIVAAFTLLYLLLPNANPSSDAVGYAATQRWNPLHCSPHHVLYHVWWTLMLKILPFLKKMDVIAVLQAGNALAAGGVLLLTGALMNRLRSEYTLAVLMVVGSSFGFMRYATENETYIMPLLFGILSLWFMMGSLHGRWWWSALALAFAMLFHQTYIFWWLPAVWYAFRTEGIKKAFIPASALLLTALVYQGAAVAEEEPLWRFVFHDVYAGGVQTSISLKNFYMTPISLLRSFIQVHGYMLWSWKHDGYWSILLSLAGLGLLVFAGIKLWRNMRKPAANPLWRHFLLPALMLHLLFAFYSEGNAEFMVMMPFLLAMGAASCAVIAPRPIIFTGLALLFWNLVHGLLPWHFRDFYGHRQLLTKWVNRPPDWFMVSEEPVMMRNLYYYHFGVQDYSLILDSPDWAAAKGTPPEMAISVIDSVLKLPLRQVLYADYSRYLFNRAKATARGAQASNGLQTFFQLETADSFKNMAGKQLIYLMKDR